MKKVFLVLFFVLAVLAPSHARAQDAAAIQREIEAARREQEALIEEQRRLQAELEKVNREAQTIGAAVKSLDTTRKKLAADIAVTQSKINSTTLTIRSLETTSADKERQIVAHRKAIATAIQSISEYSSRPLLLSMLSSAGLADLWRDRSELEGLSEKLGDEVESLRETRKLLDIEKAQREKTIAEQKSLQNQLGGQKSVVEENKKAQERLLAETKSVEAAYQKMLAENLARQKQFEEDLYRLESALRITLDPTLIPDKRPGILAWPLENVYVTQRFGKTAASGRLYASGTHNGVDFRATQGTPVMAVLSGVIKGMGNTDEQRGCGSYGRWVLVEHPNGLSTVYAHLSASIVRVGQEVGTREVIGYSGGQPGVSGSGYSTGPHLHLGLFASQGVQVRQFVESRGCKQVTVPIVDIKAYLDPLAYLPAL